MDNFNWRKTFADLGVAENATPRQLYHLWMHCGEATAPTLDTFAAIDARAREQATERERERINAMVSPSLCEG